VAGCSEPEAAVDCRTNGLRSQARAGRDCILILGVSAILIFDEIWFMVGFGAAFAVVAAAILIFAWLVDRKGKKVRAGIDELPRV